VYIYIYICIYIYIHIYIYTYIYTQISYLQNNQQPRVALSKRHRFREAVLVCVSVLKVMCCRRSCPCNSTLVQILKYQLAAMSQNYTPDFWKFLKVKCCHRSCECNCTLVEILKCRLVYIWHSYTADILRIFFPRQDGFWKAKMRTRISENTDLKWFYTFSRYLTIEDSYR